MNRKWVLILLAVAGVAIGYAVMRLTSPAMAPAAPPAAPAPGDEALPVLPPVAPSASQEPGGRGSSISVVGSMSREELIRRGLLPEPDPGATAAPPPPDAAAAPIREHPEGPPAALRFPPQVAQAASRFMCLCGCAHRLDQCPCNDQPIGAVTMLTHLQKLLAADPDPARVEAGMLDRYGDQVLAAADQP